MRRDFYWVLIGATALAGAKWSVSVLAYYPWVVAVFGVFLLFAFALSIPRWGEVSRAPSAPGPSRSLPPSGGRAWTRHQHGRRVSGGDPASRFITPEQRPTGPVR